MKIILKSIKWTGITIISITILLIITSAIRNRMGNVELDARIKGLGTTVAIVRCGKSIKVTLCINDKISCKLTTNSLNKADFFTPSSYMKLPNGERYGMSTKWVSFFANKEDKIKITGNIHKKGIDYTISGSDINLDYSKFLKQTEKFRQEVVQFDIQRKTLIINSAGQELVDEILIKQREMNKSWNIAKLDYIKDHPNLLVSTYILSRLERDTVEKYVDLIEPEARKSKYWKRIEQKVAFNKILVVGMHPPEIAEEDLNGIQIDLEKFKGRYVVLDFWGSWCGPCLRGIPNMKRYYEKYIEEVEFVGIACNDNESDLRKAIEKYDLKWTQILNKNDNDLSTKFGIEAYPTKIILDQDGKIVGIFKSEKVEFYQKLDEIMLSSKVGTNTNTIPNSQNNL